MKAVSNMSTVFISLLPPSFHSSAPLTLLLLLKFISCSLNITSTCARVLKTDHLDLDDLMRLIPEEKQWILNSPWLPVVLHLHVGPCETPPSMLECQQVLTLGATAMLCRADTVLQQDYSRNPVLGSYSLLPCPSVPWALGAGIAL